MNKQFNFWANILREGEGGSGGTGGAGGVGGGSGGPSPSPGVSPPGGTTPPGDVGAGGVKLKVPGSDTADPAKTEEKKEEASPYFGKLEEGKDFEEPKFDEASKMLLNKEMFDAFKPIAKELGLNQNGVQKLAEFIGKWEQSQAENWVNTVNDWGKSAAEDKEFGGPKFEQAKTVANKAIDVFGTPALKELLRNTGYGNNPELIRFAYRVGSAIVAEDTTPGKGAGGGAGGGSAPDPRDLFYGPPKSQ